MAHPNEITSHECRFLNEERLQELYETFVAAFSDYVIPFALTEKQFRNHINLNAVDLTRSIGCFENDRLIGFSLNGFGEWNGRSTVYDAGTGVLPEFRRQGVSESMFDEMIPIFRGEGIEQYLLEVISTNTAAISLYEKLGFRKTRELTLLQCDKEIAAPHTASAKIEIREIEVPDWGFMTTFWDGDSSWQNSVAAVERSRKMKRLLGAYCDGKCVGYIVFSSKFGRVAQLAVHKGYRNQAVGTALLRTMQSEIDRGFSPQIINLDRALSGTMNFFRNRGFYETIGQYEMMMPL
jgi:ribosomal protein S18 acetylase RimI-like enzyme